MLFLQTLYNIYTNIPVDRHRTYERWLLNARKGLQHWKDVALIL